MIIVRPSFTIETELDGPQILWDLAMFARVSYKSEANADKESAESFIKKRMDGGHWTVLEHYSITVRFICNRGVSHELVRHRLASYTQESTRFCNYSKNRFGKEITVISPTWLLSPEKEVKDLSQDEACLYRTWQSAMEMAETAYFTLLKMGAKPQYARGVLPNDLKTEIVMTANLREWRHVFSQRAINRAAHPQIRELMVPLLRTLAAKIPIVFDDLIEQLQKQIHPTAYDHVQI